MIEKFKKFYFIIKNSKISFNFPSKKKIVLLDTQTLKLYSHIFKKNRDLYCMPIRKEEINIYIAFEPVLLDTKSR